MKDAMKRARKAAGLSRQELSDMSTVSYSAISNWELGNTFPHSTAAILVCDVLGISLDEYFGREAKRRDDDEQS